jgi:hypothetical protein
MDSNQILLKPIPLIKLYNKITHNKIKTKRLSSKIIRPRMLAINRIKPKLRIRLIKAQIPLINKTKLLIKLNQIKIRLILTKQSNH